MTRLLIVETSSRGDHSISRNMTRSCVSQGRAAHPSGEVVERDLAETYLPFVTRPWLQAYALRLSDELVHELHATDHLGE